MASHFKVVGTITNGPCFGLSSICGGCKANFYDNSGNCTAQQQCKDDTSGSNCTGSTIKNDDAYCSMNMCSASDFGDSSTNCCTDVHSSPSPSGGAPAPGGLLGGSLDRSVQNSPSPKASLSGACMQRYSILAGALAILFTQYCLILE